MRRGRRGWGVWGVVGMVVVVVVGCRRGGGAGADGGAVAGGDAGAGGESGTGTGTGTGERERESAGAGGGVRECAGRGLVRARVPGIGYAVVTRERESAGGVGRADEARGVAADGETVFEAASIAKTVIATCVMQLVEEGRLELDAEAGRYVGFALRHPRGGPLTLRKLLTHRASIRDRQEELLVPAEDRALGAFLEGYFVGPAGPRAGSFFDAAPGTATRYSNVGAALAALAVERAAGERFADYSARRVFAPLGMRRTGWSARAGAPEAAVATPYAAREGGFVALAQASHAVYPVVDLRSSARDLARFARAILREGELDGARILAPASVRAMLSPDRGDREQALAWQLRTVGQARVVGHEGEDAGASTAFFLDLATGSGAVVLANGDALASGDRARAAAMETLLADLLAVARAR